MQVSRLLRLPISPNKWFLASPQHLAQDAAMGAFAQLAGQGPATVLRGMMQMRSGGAGGAGGQQRAAAGVPPGGSSAAQ